MVPLEDSAVDSLFLRVSESRTRVCMISSSASMSSSSIPLCSAIFLTIILVRAASQSFPPSNLSPSVATAVKTFPSISSMVTSKVPPPRSYTMTLFFPSSIWPNPKDMAAAVGSFMMVTSSSPATFPASFVASLSS